MQFPESWLREFCNPPLSTQQLADTLTMAGLEVEELRPVAPPFSGVVVGEIVTAAQHPNAERLRVCEVDVGKAERLTIVCGAANARAGIKVPLATVGAQLPPAEDGKPFTIGVGKLRGVESYGMLCSARELQLSEDHSGLLELPLDAKLGLDVRVLLDLDDTLFTLKLTPNLAHCLSVFGVARELSALTGAPLQSPTFTPVANSLNDVLPVNIAAPDLCGRFSGRIVRNVNPMAKTPQWMVDRLARCGQRSVTPLVDISNYVMFEVGRPSHIFDFDKIHGGLEVRWGRAGEQLKLLNGSTVELDDSVGVIADEQAVESLAGIMGGDATAVSDETRHVYVEAAFWWPRSIAGRSRRFNFSTDAGHRFERGVDPATTCEHIERITQLIVEICGTPNTQVGPTTDQQSAMPQAAPVVLRVDRVCKVLGMTLTQEQCATALRALGLGVQESSRKLIVTAPSYRFDLQIEEDLIEEIARVVGYYKLPDTPPIAPVTARILPEARRNPYAVRHAMAGLGYQETINFSFVEERWERELAGNANPIRLLNPIASQMSVMRSSLIGSLIQVLKFNQDRKAQRVRVFEVGRVFLRDPSVQNSDETVQGFDQPMRLSALATGLSDAPDWTGAKREVDFYDAKGDIQALFAPLSLRFEAADHPALHPGRCARVWLQDRPIGFVGELHPQWCQAYELNQTPILFEIDLEPLVSRQVPVFSGVSKFQAVERDIAVLVEESVSHDDLMRVIWAAPVQGLLRQANLFDIYRPANSSEKSMAIRLSLNSDGRALTDVEIDASVAAVLAELSDKLGAKQRA